MVFQKGHKEYRKSGWQERMREVRRGKHASEETKRKLSVSLTKAHSEGRHKGTKGKHWKRKELSPEQRLNLGKHNIGRKRTEEFKRNLSLKYQGDKCRFWKGGITPINLKIRYSLEYKLWRKSVFERDKYKCIWCGDNKDIQADHIKPFSLYPELRFAIDNGRTLCKPCHLTTDTWGGRTNLIKL